MWGVFSDYESTYKVAVVMGGWVVTQTKGSKGGLDGYLSLIISSFKSRLIFQYNAFFFN